MFCPSMVSVLLYGPAFDDRAPPALGDHAREREACLPKERAEVRLRARPPPYQHAHHRGEELQRIGRVGRLEHALDEEKPSVTADGAPAVREDPDGVLVVPVVDDVLEDVPVSPLGNLIEETPADDLAALGDALTSQRGGT